MAMAFLDTEATCSVARHGRGLPVSGGRHTQRWAAVIVTCLSAMPVAYAADPTDVDQAATTPSAPSAATSAVPAQAAPVEKNAIELLGKVQQAARQLDYRGIYTYSQGGFTQSSRIVHMLDGTGSRERLEILDGEPREYVRHNEDVQCLLPERKQVQVERRRSDRFPGVLLGDPAGLTANYTLAVHPDKYRVAGRKCQLVTIEPNDGLRYGYRLCVDVETNLLLKAQTVDADETLIEQVMFTALRVGSDIEPEALRPSWSTQGWEVVKLDMPAVDLAAKGWRVPPPTGFLPLMQVQRVMGQSDDVGQIVF